MTSTIPNNAAFLITKVPLLNGDNFPAWTTAMEMFFRGVGAGYVVQKVQLDKVPDGKGELDEALCSYLFFSIAEEHRYILDDTISALEAWKKVLTHFNVSTMPRRIQARHHFYHVEHDPSKSIEVYIHSITKARNALKALKCEVNDTETLDVLLMNLHSSFDSVRTTILTAKEEPSLEQVKSILLGSGRSAVQVKSEPNDIALAAQDARRGGGRNRFGSGGGQKVLDSDSDRRTPSRDDKGYRWCDPTNEGHCHRCGHSGHIAARCIHDMPQHVKDWVMSGPSQYGSLAVTDDSDSATMVSALNASASAFHPRPHTPPRAHILEFPPDKLPRLFI